MRRDVKLLFSDGHLSVVSDRNVIPPFGIAGGFSGYSNSFLVKRGDQLIEPSEFPGKVTNFHMLKGDTLLEMSNGGGGYGDPLERDPELVRQDVEEELITSDKAHQYYGVILKNGLVDEPATARMREEIKSNRLSFVIRSSGDEEYLNGRRTIRVSAKGAERMEAKENDLVEYLSSIGVPLRAWVVIDPELSDNETFMGPIGQEILAVKEGDHIAVRKIYTGWDDVEL
jgi:N-methylhydantoinase B